MAKNTQNPEDVPTRKISQEQLDRINDLLERHPPQGTPFPDPKPNIGGPLAVLGCLAFWISLALAFLCDWWDTTLLCASLIFIGIVSIQLLTVLVVDCVQGWRRDRGIEKRNHNI